MMDNCYGEFVEEKEPIEGRADMIVSSLIKNPGDDLRQSATSFRKAGVCGKRTPTGISGLGRG